MESAAVLIESLDILVEPDVLSADGRDTLRLELDLLDRVLRYEITPRSTSLDKQLREIILVDEFLQLCPLPEIDLDCLSLSVMVYGKPEDL